MLKVVVLQEMHLFREFFYDMFSWVHYVPIKTDWRICVKKYNGQKIMMISTIIAENAHEFVRNQRSLDNINLYVATPYIASGSSPLKVTTCKLIILFSFSVASSSSSSSSSMVVVIVIIVIVIVRYHTIPG